MRLDFCAVCGVTEDLHHHHFKAKIHGGDDLDTNMLTLCTKHHRELHGQNYRNNINHSKLTREGLQKAKKRGIKLGSPSPNIKYLAECRKKKALDDAKNTAVSDTSSASPKRFIARLLRTASCQASSKNVFSSFRSL